MFSAMLGNANTRGAKRRFLALLYLTCFTLSLTPTIVAPPERGFSQGQPEMHQAMDNMAPYGVVVKKAGPTFSPSGAIDYPVLLTSKTSSLLDEAEHVLSNLKDSKEKQWVEAFVHRMRAIATMLEKTVDTNEQHLPKETNSVSGTPVPVGLPLQPLRPVTSAVPGINPFQKSNRVVSKFPVTSPELSHVLPDNEDPNEHQAVTKPAILSNKQEDTEDDELVLELQSLHQEVAAEIPVQNSKMLDHTPQFTSPATPVTSERMNEKLTDVEARKASLKAKFLQEMAEYQRLGGVISNELTDALNKNHNNARGLTYPHNTMTEISKSEGNRAGMVDTSQIQSLQDLHNEENTISNTNTKSLNLGENTQTQEKQVKRMEVNHTFQNTYLNMHANMPAFPKMGNYFQYMPSQSKEQPYEKGFENAIQDFRKPNAFNFPGNYQAMGSPNSQMGYIPEALKQKMSRPRNMVYNSNLAPYGYNSYIAKPRYGPYPYMQQHWYHKNATLYLPPGMPPYIPKPSVNHQIDTQLNDEMKRQLRDGKIVVLSDSVVRSNFEGNEENKTNKPKLDTMDEKKNDTQALN